MPQVMCLYLDDSGTRNPDRKLPQQVMFRDWFTLGGFTTKEEDKGAIERAHPSFCQEREDNLPEVRLCVSLDWCRGGFLNGNAARAITNGQYHGNLFRDQNAKKSC